jgi:hypothetical protein
MQINPENGTMSKLVRTASVLALVLLLAFAALPASAQSGNMWNMQYFANTSFSGSPVFSQGVSLVSFNWGYGSPAPSVPVDYFSAVATTDAYFYGGVTRFTVQADDDVSLIIDGFTYLNTIGQGQSGKSFTIDVPLNQGYHNVRVNYIEYTQLAYVYVNWTFVQGGTGSGTGGGSTGQPVPSATSVQTKYGDYTPCIQQGTHQVNCFVPSGAWDSPNEGSIAMEPQIVVWGNCQSDTTTSMQMFVNEPPQSAKCSKTEAGWYPL